MTVVSYFAFDDFAFGGYVAHPQFLLQIHLHFYIHSAFSRVLPYFEKLPLLQVYGGLVTHQDIYNMKTFYYPGHNPGPTCL